MTVENPWKKQVQRKKSPTKGDYWLLSRSCPEGRESISLGYGLTDDEAVACETGMKILVDFRNLMREAMTRDLPAWEISPDGSVRPMPIPKGGWSMGGPPAGASAPLPEMAGSTTMGLGVPIFVSPDHLRRVLQEATTPAEKELAQTRVRTFLLKIFEARPDLRNGTVAELVRTVQEIARAAKLGVDPGAMALRTYYDAVWAPERARARPRSWETERHHWTALILPALGHIAVKDLDGPTFDNFITTFTLKNGKAPAGATRANVRVAYVAMLTYAARKGHRKPKHEIYRIDGSTKRVRVNTPLTLPEIHAILQHAPTPMHRALFAYAFDEGARPTEVVKLDWGDLDFTPSARAPLGTVRIAGTKTELADARVPLFPLAHQELLAWWDACGRPNEGPAFTWQGQGYTGQATFRRALKSAAENAGIHGKRIFPNLARHTTATTAAQAQVPRAQIAAQLRHSDEKMVAETYDLSGYETKIDARAFPDRRAVESPAGLGVGSHAEAVERGDSNTPPESARASYPSAILPTPKRRPPPTRGK